MRLQAAMLISYWNHTRVGSCVPTTPWLAATRADGSRSASCLTHAWARRKKTSRKSRKTLLHLEELEEGPRIVLAFDAGFRSELGVVNSQEGVAGLLLEHDGRH